MSDVGWISVRPKQKSKYPMEIPSGVKPGVWGAAAGAIAMAVIGVLYLGWTTASTSEKLAQDTANTAVVAALVPFCIVKAEADTNPATLTKFQTEQSSYSRTDIVAKAGWVWFDDKAAGNDALARACAEKLHVAKAG
jgi:hypothetical protein